MENRRITDWLNDLGSKSPTPGGGAVAAFSAALAAAQLKMVCEYSTGKKFTGVESKMLDYSAKLDKLKDQALEQIEADANAFLKLSKQYKKTDVSSEQMDEALFNAAIPPSKVIEISEKILEIAEHAADSANKNLLSDVAVTSSTLRSAIESAIVNIEINKKSMKNKQKSDELGHSVNIAEALVSLASELTAKVQLELRGN